MPAVLDAEAIAKLKVRRQRCADVRQQKPRCASRCGSAG
jgi:hypothetical protein